MTVPDPPPAERFPEAVEATHVPVVRGPVRERALLPDVLRGVALLGILIVNAQDFAGFREWQQHGLDRAVQVVTDIFANGRFISIFAMLFGWGAAGMLQRNAGAFLKRHVILLLIGTAHFVLVWHGDIIANYALLAFALLLTASLNARTLVVLAVALGGWWLFAALAAGFGSSFTSPRFSGLPELFPGQSYPEVVGGRASEFFENLIGGSVYNGPWLWALFCLGAAAQRTGLLSRPHEHARALRRLSAWGLTVGLPLGVLLAWMNTRDDFATGLLAIPVRMAGGLASALGYVGVIGLLTVQGRLGFLRHFASSGRVAMSNYLAQSVVMTSVFYPYAGAQWGKWGAASAVALALGLGLLQLPISAWWIRRQGSGPVEWLVRALVYGLPRKAAAG